MIYFQFLKNTELTKRKSTQKERAYAAWLGPQTCAWPAGQARPSGAVAQAGTEHGPSTQHAHAAQAWGGRPAQLGKPRAR